MNTLHLSDDGTLVYHQAGDGDVLLCVHGWGVAGELFHQQLTGLSETFRVIAPDLRGHGASSAFREGMSFGVLADDLAELIASLQAPRIVLLGWSMGAMVCWDLLSRHQPERVAAMVSVDMVPCILNDEGWVYGLKKGSDASAFDRSIAAMLADWPSFCSRFVSRIYSPEHTRSGIDRTLAVALANEAESMALIWQAMADQDFRARLTEIDIPMLAVYGAKSQLYQPAAGQWLARHVPRGSALEFPDSGHSPHLEEPDAFNRAVTQFAEEVSLS